jgi:hypothetical protein
MHAQRLAASVPAALASSTEPFNEMLRPTRFLSNSNSYEALSDEKIPEKE